MKIGHGRELAGERIGTRENWAGEKIWHVRELAGVRIGTQENWHARVWACERICIRNLDFNIWASIWSKC